MVSKSIKKADKQLSEFKPFLDRAKNEIRDITDYIDFDNLDYKRILIKNMNLLLKQELDFIKMAYKDKDPITGFVRDENLLKIDQFVKKLPYFIKFHPDIRKKLLKHAQLEYFNRGEFIFKEGDFGNNIYIILYGSVNILIKKSHPAFKKPLNHVRSNLIHILAS